MKNKASLKKNIVLNYVKTLMSLIFPLITFPYASRVLGPAGIGKVNFATSVISYFTLIASLGISGYGIREGAKIRDDKEKLSQFTQEVFTINMISTVAAYFLLIVSILFIPKLQMYQRLLVISSATILFSTIGMDWLYTVTESFAYITIRAAVFQAIGVVLLYIFVHDENDYFVYAAILVFTNVGSNVMNFIHSRKFISFSPKRKLILWKHLLPIFLLFALSAVSSIYNMLDSTMLGFLASDVEVGIYTAATKVNRLTVSLVTSTGTVFLPRLVYIYEKERGNFEKLAQKSINLTLLISLPACVGLIVLAKPIILLLNGEQYLSAVPVMRVMSPIIVALGISNFTGVQLFLTLKKERLTLISDICGAVVNFSLNVVFILKYGALGAAIASVCAESMVTIVQLFFARNDINILKILQSVIRYLLPSLVMGTVVAIETIFVSSIYLQLFFGVLCGLGIYFLLLLLLKDQCLMEILDQVKKKIGKKERKISS